MPRALRADRRDHCRRYDISLRLLESATDEDRPYPALSRATLRFSSPPAIRFRAIDGLLSNFHLPQIDAVHAGFSALMGLERMQAAYAHAIANGYRFYSYGDSSLLLP